jgi:hypothetical protein
MGVLQFLLAALAKSATLPSKWQDSVHIGVAPLQRIYAVDSIARSFLNVYVDEMSRDK